MSLNYDPKLNRMREFRFKGVDYDQLRLEMPEDILSPEEYGTLVKETYKCFTVEKFVLCGSLIGQVLFSRTAAFKQLNGYLRATAWAGVLSVPWLSLRTFNARALNSLYDGMLLKRLEDAYERPLSYKP